MIFWPAIEARVLDFLPRLGLAVIIFFIGLYLSKIISRIVRRGLERREPSPAATDLVVDLTRWGILVLGIVMAFQQFVDVTAFLAGLGIIGFTIGFALQDVMKNFASGVILLAQQPFRVGDSVEVGDYEGTVQAIDLRSTEIKTFDGLIAILPNADVLNHAIVNYTRSLQRRIEVVIGVAYGTDLKLAREITLEAIRAIPGYLEEPAALVGFNAFGESSIHMSVLVWFDTAEAGPVKARDAAIEAIKAAFDANKIDIPFPIRTVLTAKE
ncbi:MAG: mechanosensitive ion channel [Anaerolineales bacterium]|nr:mechanosensitive ion channel [Anaerolineales bacterium]